MKRLRILISAHEFSPEQGSECAVGWNIATRLAAYHDVTVLCADGPPLWPNTYRNAIARYFKQQGDINGLKVVFVAQPPITLRYAQINRKLMKLTRGVGWQPLYYFGLDAWHKAVRHKAAKIGLRNFDAVHQLTPIGFLKPGYLWTFDKPFFWGPIGGMLKAPVQFAKAGGTKPYMFETLRSFNIERKLRTNGFNRIVRKAKRIWTISDDEHRIVNTIDGDKATAMIESAAPKQIESRIRHYDGKRPLRLCWSGAHEHIKALPLLLHTIASLTEKHKVALDVMGQGPETHRWKDLSVQLGLDNIHWHGRLPYHMALGAMNKTDIFVHTSYREGTPHVILEALGWGMPVICHDACGMSVAVNHTCGIKVPLINPERSIEGFRSGIELFFNNPPKVKQFSEGAIRRSSELSWDAKVSEISKAYSKEIIGAL